MAGASARVARAGRLWVEGVHDAELVEQVWGDDLRIEGVVVERLDGIDHLGGPCADVPARARPVGWVCSSTTWCDGSKESRIAAGVRHPDVLVTGTPFVDVWEAVRPSVLGHRGVAPYPDGAPSGRPGCAPPSASGTRRRPGGGSWPSVSTYADLEPALVGAVERLIDFVTSTD